MLGAVIVTLTTLGVAALIVRNPQLVTGFFQLLTSITTRVFALGG